MNDSASVSLYVGNLASEVNEPFLFEIFNSVGPVASIRVCRDAATRESLGYAYVNFHNHADAELALDSMNFTNIAQQPCRIMWSQRDPSIRKSGEGNIFVKNLSPNIDNRTLADTFGIFGKVLSCKVSLGPNGESLRYGFVHFETESVAATAIEKVNGMVIDGQAVEVTKFVPRSERQSEKTFTNVYVKNLPSDFNDQKLRELFEHIGTIQSSKASIDNQGLCRGFGFVNFDKFEEAAKAVETMHGSDCGDNKLYVSRAMTKKERSRVLRDNFETMKAELARKTAGCNLYVKNLADSIDRDALIEAFSKFGTIESAVVMIDQSGKSRGFGFVCYETNEQAKTALHEMNGFLLEEKPLYVAYAQPKEMRRAQLSAHFQKRSVTTQSGPLMFRNPQQMASMVLGYPGVPQHMASVVNGPNFHHPGMHRGYQGPASHPIQNQVQNQQPGQTQTRPKTKKSEALSGDLTLQALANASPQEQRQLIGERIYPLVREIDERRAGKITGMLLEMDNSDLLELIESSDALNFKVKEAISVLNAHERATN